MSTTTGPIVTCAFDPYPHPRAAECIDPTWWQPEAAPQPALDAEGEWRVVPMDIHGWSIVDANDREVAGNIYREEDAAQIASDHNSVIKLLAALNDARHRISLLETERSTQNK